MVKVFGEVQSSETVGFMPSLMAAASVMPLNAEPDERRVNTWLVCAPAASL